MITNSRLYELEQRAHRIAQSNECECELKILNLLIDAENYKHVESPVKIDDFFSPDDNPQIGFLGLGIDLEGPKEPV